MIRRDKTPRYTHELCPGVLFNSRAEAKLEGHRKAIMKELWELRPDDTEPSTYEIACHIQANYRKIKVKTP